MTRGADLHQLVLGSLLETSLPHGKTGVSASG